MSSSLKILHVSDSFNAGVKVGIERIVAGETLETHYLLWSSHSDSPRPSDFDLTSKFSQTFEWNGTLIQKYFVLDKLIRNIRPDVVHLHSSIAGGLGRMQISRKRIFYSPHCYAFQRKDISNFVRLGILLIERVLKFKTDTYFLNWPIEIELTREKIKAHNILFYPIVDIEGTRIAQYRSSTKNQVFLCVGRIRPQKDPKFLTESIQYLQENLNIEWVGSGEHKLRKELESAGIVTVPWRNQSQIWNDNGVPVALLITSAWESGPLTLFESIQNGVPVISRSFDAVQYYGFKSFDTPISFGLEIESFLTNPNIHRIRFREQQRALLETFDKYILSFGKSGPYS